MLIIIAADTLPFWVSDEPAVELWRIAKQSFVAVDGLNQVSIQASGFDGDFVKKTTCTPDLNAHTLAIPQITDYSTTDAATPTGTFSRYGAAFYTPDGTFICDFKKLNDYFLRHTNTPTTWEIVEIDNDVSVDRFMNYRDFFIAQTGRMGWVGRELNDGEISPNVDNCDWLGTNNTTPQVLNPAGFTNSRKGQRLSFIFGDAVTQYPTAQGNLSFGTGSILTIRYNGIAWLFESMIQQ